MKNILFPTNFSDISYKAFEYAIEYAKKMNYKIIIFHTYDPNADMDPNLMKVYEEIDVENFKYKQDTFPAFDKLIEEHGATDIKIKSIVTKGDFLDSLKTYVAKKEDKIDLIIMGTANHNRKLFDLFTETKTIRILEEVNKPVLVIPEKSDLNGGLNNIVFLVDYREDEREALLDLIDKTSGFGAKLYVVHFDLAHGESIVPLMEQFKASLRIESLPHLEFVTIDSISLKTSLSDFCTTHKIDMVCLINHEKNFYQRLFSFSLTEDLINNLSIPVMAIYAD